MQSFILSNYRHLYKKKNRIGDKSPTQIAKVLHIVQHYGIKECAISAWDTEYEKRGEMTITGYLKIAPGREREIIKKTTLQIQTAWWNTLPVARYSLQMV